MRKKIKQTEEQQKLYNELAKLAKKANQRLVRMEKLVGKQEVFGAKYLYDYLNISNIQAINRKGRVKVTKNYSVMQLVAINKVLNNFLDKEVSTVKEIREKTKEYSEKLDTEITFVQASTIYIAGKNYIWIYEYIKKSEFWDNINVAKEYNWSSEEFIEQLRMINEKLNDETLKADLEGLYLYCVKGEA